MKNTAILYGRYDFETDPDAAGATAASAYLPGLNVDIAATRTWRGWTSTDFYGDLEDFSSVSVVYVNTHGASESYVANPPAQSPLKRPGTYLYSDFADPLDPNRVYGDLDFIYPDSSRWHPSNGTVLASRQAAMGSGDPPYNSTGKPPIWFAWNDACLAANDNAFADAYLWPYTNAYDDNLCEDQAQMGWSIETPVTMSRPEAQAVWIDAATGAKVGGLVMK